MEEGLYRQMENNRTYTSLTRESIQQVFQDLFNRDQDNTRRVTMQTGQEGYNTMSRLIEDTTRIPYTWGYPPSQVYIPGNEPRIVEEVNTDPRMEEYRRFLSGQGDLPTTPTIVSQGMIVDDVKEAVEYMLCK